jgi:hypothetical protein
VLSTRTSYLLSTHPLPTGAEHARPLGPIELPGYDQRARGGFRPHDLILTEDVLYQLSYTGEKPSYSVSTGEGI